MNVSNRAFAVITAVLVVLDQWTKYLAVAGLTRAFDGAAGLWEKLVRFQTEAHPRPYRAVTVLEDFWHFRYAENTGAAFSFLASSPDWFRRPFFLLVSAGAMVAIWVYFTKTPKEHRMLRLSLALVFGGALGNFVDRLRLGYVIDFISWHWYDKATWPTFNVADSAISVGVALLLIGSFLPEPRTDAIAVGDNLR
jgi:signal peptidase II